MSRDNRLDRLESDIVDALRRAPGAAPSADLDARILAQAHAAVATPRRRGQPVWFSMAAGLVVLVGSGLALRIWQQVERAPSALDMPAANVNAPAKPAVGQDDAAAGEAARASGAAAELSAQQRQQEPVAANGGAHSNAASADSPIVASPTANLQSLQTRREMPAASTAKLETAPNILAPRPIQEMRDASADMAASRPFPASTESVPASTTVASALKEAVPERVAQPGFAAAPPVAVAVPSAAAPAPAAEPPARLPPALAEDLGVLDITEPESPNEAAAEMATGIAVTGSVAGATDALAKRDRAEEADLPTSAPDANGPVDAFAKSLSAIREALAAGDEAKAHRLLTQLRRRFPDRTLPDDLRDWADPPQ